ncbi:MAG: T9SS type A sorting domain-containing protein [Chitinophagales bacterium]
MKKIKTISLVLALCAMNHMSNAQWLTKASGFPVPQTGMAELIAVGDSVVWGVAIDVVNAFRTINDFTRTTDGGNHWTAGNINLFPDYTLVGIAPLSATLCYGTIANFDTSIGKVVKTSDGGSTWTEQLNYDFGQTFSFFADIYFFNANEGLIFGDPSDGYFTIFTTQDGGSHWTRVPQANMPAALTDEFSYVFSSEGVGNTFWTVSSSGRIWKTIYKGLHWDAYQTQDTLIEFSNLKMRDALHGLWGVHGELYRTSDGGITWTELETSGTWFTNDLAYVPGTASTWVSTGAHDFPGYAENGSLHGIGTSYSIDDGHTWITIDTAVEHLSLAMVNSYTGFTGGVNLNANAKGIFKYNGSALGYSCGNNLTSMCHKGKTLCVANASIANHLSKGDVLGACSGGRMEASATNDLSMSVFPNPLSNSTTISFSISTSQNVSLQVFDVTGILVAPLAERMFEEGENKIEWNVENENPGIYFLRMQTANESETIRLSVVK